MIPGVNPKQLKMMMKQMGMSQDSLNVTEVIIKTQDGKSYVFNSPQVDKVSMQGQDSFQIQGSYEVVEKELNIEISHDDITTVMEQANVDEKTAKAALEESNGDLAQAIVSLSPSE